ncbi:MAG: hypothetical protein JW953_12820 [Anaerolineae bacterium]|nr:hypothetical protein [Anaerolineae bacterium]
MNKREKHKQDLIELLDQILETGEATPLRNYIAANSNNLPGPRGNLELAQAWGEVVEAYAGPATVKLWNLCVEMANISADEAPVNDPKELIPFCGAVGVGAIGSVLPEFFDRAITTLKNLANDSRWRMREAVPMGLTKLLTGRSRDTLQTLAAWTVEGSLLELRAVAAGVAEPALLKNDEIAATALELHQNIFKRVLKIEPRKTEDFRILKKALGYTLSVVVKASPQPGFTYMAQLVDTQDKDIQWIVKENLKKNRLVKNFPKEVATIKRQLK